MPDPNSNFTTIELNPGNTFQVGALPPELKWDAATFATVWNLHPTEKHVIHMPGGPVETPRFQQAYGANYHYTGRVNKALPLPELLQPLLSWAQRTIHSELNGLLLNWYDGPGHYIGPHHDSVKKLVDGAPIVTISFGETRTFRLTPGKKVTGTVRNFPAPDGTVFVLPYETNLKWKHSVPKSARYTARRISVTVRAFLAEEVLSEVE